MIDNVQHCQIAPVMGTNGSPHADATNKRVTDESDATLQVNFGDLIDQAVQASKADVDPVEKARELLASGRLTSLQNIRSAAEDLARFGI